MKAGMKKHIVNIMLPSVVFSMLVGVITGAGSHTRAEWIEKSSLLTGSEVGLQYVLELFGL